MDQNILIVPGIGNSGPLHWQSLWQAARPGWRRLAVPDWDQVRCADWVAALEAQAPRGGIIVAHSLGCLAVAHWAARGMLHGALLVAVPDPHGPAFPDAASGFAPLPMERLPFPTIIAASSNDPYGSMEHARVCASAWGSELVSMGAHGHLNAASGLGGWPAGWRLLERLAARR
jgi:uncharacterized protein